MKRTRDAPYSCRGKTLNSTQVISINKCGMITTTVKYCEDVMPKSVDEQVAIRPVLRKIIWNHPSKLKGIFVDEKNATNLKRCEYPMEDAGRGVKKLDRKETRRQFKTRDAQFS